MKAWGSLLFGIPSTLIFVKRQVNTKERLNFFGSVVLLYFIKRAKVTCRKEEQVFLN